MLYQKCKRFFRKLYYAGFVIFSTLSSCQYWCPSRTCSMSPCCVLRWSNRSGLFNTLNTFNGTCIVSMTSTLSQLCKRIGSIIFLLRLEILVIKVPLFSTNQSKFSIRNVNSSNHSYALFSMLLGLGIYGGLHANKSHFFPRFSSSLASCIYISDWNGKLVFSLVSL